ncbi:integrin alpha-M-like [Rana temporaria]|uniref:integrin alpha-M-like n=1 Tax=Rana temporaria TaxID=8407 RepID=UPI001AAD50FE|nr:integrin alpha-M-like [Rana temporaria]
MGGLLTWLLLHQALSSASAFFVDTTRPIIFQNVDPSFGHQVVQMDKWVIVSAPLHRESQNKTGRLYRCDPQTASCNPMPIPGSSDDDINSSLGLSLVVQENPPQLLVCGPTLQRPCGGNIYVNGRCYYITGEPPVMTALPRSLPECSGPALDIVFLIDGSGSIVAKDFTLMLNFITRVMEEFKESNTQFALMQYSERFRIHFDFTQYSQIKDPAKLTKPITQRRGGTHTSSAILAVMQNLFMPGRGVRENAEKVLIVITDGESIRDPAPYSMSIGEADRLKVRRFVIGVGDAFSVPSAQQELETIASPKAEDHLLQVDDFSILQNFQRTLQDKIFAIEGTQSANVSSFQLEMSQEGFSAVLTSRGPVLGAVGAYDWSGGISLYLDGQQNGTWINATKDRKDMKDSYMGYAVQQLQWDTFAIGAPRYQHLGSVFIYMNNPTTSEWSQVAAFTADKIGSYFGSVLSVLTLNSTHSLLVVGAPTYYSPEAPGGRVYLCPVTEVRNFWHPKGASVTMTCPETLHGDPSQSVGHFGSAISILPDMTGDQLSDLAVGAPCEDNYQGAIYIFPGQGESFRTSYIQRISGRQVSGGIKYFGRSLSGNLDMTKDNLPDLVVGAEGRVLIARSRPVLGVSVSMTFDPIEIPLSFYECSDKRKVGSAIKLNICFFSYQKNNKAKVEDFGRVTYSLLLDAGRTNTRALFTSAGRSLNATKGLLSGQVCADHSIQIPECVEDSLSALRVSLNFSLVGTPVLSEDSLSSQSAEIPFQKNCGGDGVCEDNLSLKIAFTGVSQVVVGVTLDVNVTVTVKNEGEDSYNTRVLIPFPSGLSYRMVSLVETGNRKVTVSCASLEAQRVVNCGVNRPILKPNTTAVFLVGFHVSPTAALGKTLILAANVNSDYRRAPTDRMMSSSQLGVRYAIYVTITSLEESSKFQNFSKSDSTIQHIYRVRNLGQRSLPLTVIFMVPVRVGETSIWQSWNITSSEPDLSTCTEAREAPGVENYQEILARTPILNCSVGWCVRVECEIQDLKVQSSLNFTISGSVTKESVTQTGQQKISLQTSAEIRYDSQTYAHILEQNQRFVRTQTQTTLEINVEYNYFPIIIGSSVGGLVLLALIAAGLYKLGFFKRQYKNLLENPDVPGAEGTEQAPLDE